MSADLLAEFDSFYQAPQDGNKRPAPASNNLSFLSSKNANNTTQNTNRGSDGQGRSMAQWQTPTSKPNDDIWGNMASFQPSNARQAPTIQDDPWGSFEAEEEAKPPVRSYAAPKPNYGGGATALRQQSKPMMQRRDTLEMFSNNMNDWGQNTAFKSYSNPARAVPKNPAPPIRKTSSGGDILFDADELSEDEDDFGDFETGVSSDHPPPQPPSQSLEGLFGATSMKPKPTKRPLDLLPTSSGLNNGNLPYPQAPKSPSFQERNPFTDLGLSTSKISSIKKESEAASPVTAWPTFEPNTPRLAPYQDSPAPTDEMDDEWGDFADLPAEAPVQTITKNISGIEADAWAWDSTDRVSEKTNPTKAVDMLPPTNIPPPSVLLPLFPPLFDLPQSALFKPVGNQIFSLKTRILSNPSIVQFLQAYLLIATVAARIIAGRKQRWKRDTLLSQAMKIGPSAAGGKGGMKLACVDKAEVTREDREAADVVRVWKDQLSRLRSAVAVANSSIQDASVHLIIPEISDTIHVKSQEGAMTAPKPCLVCGMKREERIVKIDLQVEDSFGEWWTEHWGHRACRNFWQEHESKLKHR